MQVNVSINMTMRIELVVIVFHLLAFVLFMQGLFPFSSSSSSQIANRSCFDGQSACSTNRRVVSRSAACARLDTSDRHVILMLIDALRSDYVFNTNSSYHFKSIERLRRRGKVLTSELRTHTPTVTLPRIKVNVETHERQHEPRTARVHQALLTGTIPSFWDVIFNYNCSRLELDNLLAQYKSRFPKRKIVFYGDDTWLKLFPDKIFDRSHGLQSFFVKDFDEVRRRLSLCVGSLADQRVRFRST
jgi:ethanolamine phosphate transferase 2 subunit G